MFGGSTSSGFGTSNSLSSSGSTYPKNYASTSTSQAPSTGASSSGSSKLLKDLLESASNLPTANELEFGSIHLALNELQRRSQQLRKSHDQDSNYMKAHYLLASSGMSADEIESEINQIKVPEADSKTSLNISNNLEGYLSTKKDENILNSIEQSLSIASKDFDTFINANVNIDWKTRKDELRKIIGLRPGLSEESKSSPVLWNKLVPGSYNILSPLNGSTSTSLKHLPRDKFESYSKIIYDLNESRLAQEFVPLLLNFEELNKLSSNLKSKQMSAVYKILVELTGEKFAKVNQEQKFYHESEFKSLNNKIITSSKAYLETQFLNYLNESFFKDENDTASKSSSNVDKVSHLIKNIMNRNDPNLLEKTLTVNGSPVWAIIFYLMRSGLYKEAVEFTWQNKDNFNKFDKNFPFYIKKFVESKHGTLPQDLNDRLQQEFNMQFSFISDNDDNFDPYKYSVYKIIGKSDPGKRSLPNSVNLSIEDWLWFHLSIINESQSSGSSLVFENYTLQSLQKKVISLGVKKLNSSSNNPMYLKTLVLVGLYELAVQYAYDYVSEHDAVHLAIGLNYYGLLRVSSYNPQDELIVFGKEYEINFARLVGSYTRGFKISDPKVASQYLILIALSKGGDSNDEVSKCHEALRELLILSREFSMLLGEINQVNGEKKPGILEKQRSLIQLPELGDFYHQIIEISALRCEEEGRVLDALILYQSCQEFSTVISLINKLLGELLSSIDLDEPLSNAGNYKAMDGEVRKSETPENNIILLSQQIMGVFDRNSYISEKIPSKKKDTCRLLLSIVDIRDYFIKRDFRSVLQRIQGLNILPIGINDDLSQIRRLSEVVKDNFLDENLVKIIPSLLIMTMTSISQLSYLILIKKYKALNDERIELSQLREIAKNCMIYAGMVQYKMPRETYSLLINLEASL